VPGRVEKRRAVNAKVEGEKKERHGSLRIQEGKGKRGKLRGCKRGGREKKRERKGGKGKGERVIISFLPCGGEGKKKGFGVPRETDESKKEKIQ